MNSYFRVSVIKIVNCAYYTVGIWIPEKVLSKWSKVVRSSNGLVFECLFNTRLNLVRYSNGGLNTRLPFKNRHLNSELKFIVQMFLLFRCSLFRFHCTEHLIILAPDSQWRLGLQTNRRESSSAVKSWNRTENFRAPETRFRKLLPRLGPYWIVRLSLKKIFLYKRHFIYKLISEETSWQ